jgi:hypothetical protein
VHFINEKYIWVFENSETDKIFKATYNFVLDNLVIEGENTGATSFKVELLPG